MCVAHVASVCARRFCFPFWRAIARTHTRPEKRRIKNAYAHQCTRQKAYFSCTAVWPPMGRSTRANPKRDTCRRHHTAALPENHNFVLGSHFLVRARAHTCVCCWFRPIYFGWPVVFSPLAPVVICYLLWLLRWLPCSICECQILAGQTHSTEHFVAQTKRIASIKRIRRIKCQERTSAHYNIRPRGEEEKLLRQTQKPRKTTVEWNEFSDVSASGLYRRVTFGPK